MWIEMCRKVIVFFPIFYTLALSTTLDLRSPDSSKLAISINNQYYLGISCCYQNFSLRLDESVFPQAQQFWGVGFSYRINLNSNMIINYETGLEGQYGKGIFSYWGLLYASYTINRKVIIQPVLVSTNILSNGTKYKLYGAINYKICQKMGLIAELAPKYMCRIDKSNLNLGVVLNFERLSSKVYVSRIINNDEIPPSTSLGISVKLALF